MQTSSRAPRHLPYAVLAVAAVIAYGSLFPFDFDASRWQAAAASGELLRWHAPSRGDVVANLILYAPLGALLLLIGPRRPRAYGIAPAVLAGTGMSLAIELLQNFVPDRTPSLVDVVLNAASAGIGALVAHAWRDRLPARHALLARLSTWLREPHDGIGMLVLGLWVAAHTAPFVPHADPGATWQALRPLREFAMTPQGLLEWSGSYLLLASIVRATVRHERFWSAFLALSIACLVCRLIFVRQSLGPDELLAFALSLPSIAVLRQLPSARTLRVVVACCGGAWLASGLAPFDFRAPADAFDWRPFAGFLASDVENGVRAFLEKATFYTGWAWLAARAGLPRGALLAGGTLALAGLEAAQCFLPSRSAEITDPLMFLLIATVATAATTPARRHSRATTGAVRTAARATPEGRSGPRFDDPRVITRGASRER